VSDKLHCFESIRPAKGRMADNAPTGNTCGYVARWNDAGSSGDTGTIDDNYRSIWSYIWGNPEALTAMVRPLNLFNDRQTFDPRAGYPKNVSFPFNYSAHYLGAANRTLFQARTGTLILPREANRALLSESGRTRSCI
jgi:hypothetical protein